MATTTAAAVADQIPEIWADLLYAQAENKTFWSKFEGGPGSGMPIIRNDDLSKQAGDTIHTDMVLELVGAGVTGDTNALTGNEEALLFNQLDFTVDDLSHAVAWTFKAKALMTHDLRKTALNQLQKWLAGKIDDAIWSEFTGGGTTIPTQNKYFAGTGNTGVNDLALADVLTLDDVSAIKAQAQADLQIEPIRTDNGDEFFGLALDPWAAKSLKTSDDYKEVAQYAQVRGDDNPLFRGSLITWDGVVLYQNNRVPSADNTVPIRYAKSVFFGAQAMTRGYAMYPTWTEEESDYGRKIGVATTLIKGEKLSVFDESRAQDGSGDKAIGSIVVYSSAPSA